MNRDDIEVGKVYHCREYEQPGRLVTRIESGAVSFVWAHPGETGVSEYKVDIDIFAQWVRDE